MELQRIVRAQTDVQTNLEEVRQWVPLVCQEERIIAERAHSDADLLQVEQVLKRRNFAEENAVRDGVRGEESGGEMVGIACFARVWTEYKCVYIEAMRIIWPMRQYERLTD